MTQPPNVSNPNGRDSNKEPNVGPSRSDASSPQTPRASLANGVKDTPENPPKRKHTEHGPRSRTGCLYVPYVLDVKSTTDMKCRRCIRHRAYPTIFSQDYGNGIFPNSFAT